MPVFCNRCATEITTTCSCHVTQVALLHDPSLLSGPLAYPCLPKVRLLISLVHSPAAGLYTLCFMYSKSCRPRRPPRPVELVHLLALTQLSCLTFSHAVTGGGRTASVSSRSGPLPSPRGAGSHLTLPHPSHGVTSTELALTGSTTLRLGSVASVGTVGGTSHFSAAAYVRIYEHGMVTQEWPMSKEDADAIMAMLGRGRCVTV